MIFYQTHKNLSISLDYIEDIFFQLSIIPNGIACFKNVNSVLNTSISSHLEASVGQSSNIYLNVDHFSIPVLIRHL